MKTKLSEQSLKDLHQTVMSFFVNDGDPDAQSIADDTISELKEGTFTFALWDAMGSDDLSLVTTNLQLSRLYKEISEEWQSSILNLRRAN